MPENSDRIDRTQKCFSSSLRPPLVELPQGVLTPHLRVPVWLGSSQVPQWVVAEALGQDAGGLKAAEVWYCQVTSKGSQLL